ncbi:MAG: ANTAR domain-containing protein [Gammaproteobacteria bacterium]|jgi:response regulator NasT
MNLILVADCADSSHIFLRAAAQAGYRILKLIGTRDDASRYVESLCPDALIIVSEAIDCGLLSEMQAITRRRPTPMLVFTHDSQPDAIDAAVSAGATAYIVDCNDAGRLGALLEVARVRFTGQQRLKNELLETRNALKERKRIEKAKGIIMQTKRVNEDQAYNAIRKLAMNHNKRMGEIAEQIISASEVLV